MALLHYMKLPIFLLILGPLETKSFDTNTNALMGIFEMEMANCVAVFCSHNFDLYVPIESYRVSCDQDVTL